MRSFLVALAFLTLTPVRFAELPDAGVVARSRFWYPVVGLLLGGVLAGWAWLLTQVSSPLPGAFLVLAAWVAASGALHLDGWCDLCDGLGGGYTVAERLRILKDPHLGTCALVGGALLLLGKFAGLADLLARFPAQLPWALLAAVSVARCLVVAAAAGVPYPRPEGTGKAFITAIRFQESFVFIALAFGLAALAFAVPVLWLDAALPRYFAWAVAASAAAMLALRWLCLARLGGLTGDCLGAVIELTELTFLLTLALLP